MVLRRGLQICSAQHNSCPARWSDEFAGERSCGNGSTSSERVRLLLPCPQERWWSKAHSRSQTSESRPYETAIQNDHIETDPLANMPMGLVLFAGSEWRLLSHLDNPHPRWFLRFAFEGVAYQYTVLPFELSLAPRIFMKCMDAALSLLRQLGIHVLIYLNDWLILDEFIYITDPCSAT